LSGGNLRGLMNLTADPQSEPFVAVRLRGKHLSEPLPFDGRGVLVMLQQGQLAIARRAVDRYDGAKMGVDVRPITPDDLVAQDVTDVLPNIARVLRVHAAKTQECAERYDAMAQIAEKIVSVFGELSRT